MSEEKRVPAWDEIFKVEAAINKIGEASAALVVAKPTFLATGPTEADVVAAMSRNEATIRSLREWLNVVRPSREAEDLARKKAGLA